MEFEMNTFMKWFSLATAVISPVLVLLLLYGSNWLSAITWVCIGITGLLNYVTVKQTEEMKQLREEMQDDYRS